MKRQEIAIFQFRVAVAAGHQGLGIAVGALEAQMDVVEPAGAGDGVKHLFGQRAVLVSDDVEDRHALQGARILARQKRQDTAGKGDGALAVELDDGFSPAERERNEPLPVRNPACAIALLCGCFRHIHPCPLCFAGIIGTFDR